MKKNKTKQNKKKKEKSTEKSINQIHSYKNVLTRTKT